MASAHGRSDSSFIEKLDADALEFFNSVSAKPFADQAISFLNAYWRELGDQAEFIYSMSWEIMKYADMHAKGVSLIHLYDEGNNVDFDIGLYFYEQLCKKIDEEKQWKSDEYKKSQPTFMTAIVRKKQLRDKVDVNFDGRVSFLEYLLDQYSDFANPAEFAERGMASGDEHPEVRKARLAMEAVSAKIKAYEAEKYRLEEGSKQSGIKGTKCKHELAILKEGPLMEALNEALIHAEAAVRAAAKKFGGPVGSGGSADDPPPTMGSIWWMERDLKAKKERYGR